MVWSFASVIDDIAVGEAIEEGPVKYLPLRRKAASDLDYLTIDRAMAEELVSITETSEAGQVPTLKVANSATQMVLIPDGSMLKGCKQNRIVSISILLAPQSVTDIPVCCVEQGRWRSVSPNFSTEGSGDKKMRAMLCKGATLGYGTIGKPVADQGQVWGEVADSLLELKATSGSSDYQAAFAASPALSAKPVELPADACGVALVLDDVVETIDLFDRPSTLQEVWPRLSLGYRLAALRKRRENRRAVSLESVFREIASSKPSLFANVGVGKTLRYTSPLAVGAALVEKNRAVHVSIFTEEDDGGAKSPEPSPPTKRPWRWFG